MFSGICATRSNTGRRRSKSVMLLEVNTRKRHFNRDVKVEIQHITDSGSMSQDACEQIFPKPPFKFDKSPSFKLFALSANKTLQLAQADLSAQVFI